MLDVDRNFTLDNSGNWSILSGADATQQALESELGTNQGEWAFDLFFGVPWLFQILGQSGDSAAIRQLITSKITSNREVASISAFDAEADESARGLRYTVRVRLVGGGTATLSV
jgi:hypothetical protein